MGNGAGCFLGAWVSFNSNNLVDNARSQSIKKGLSDL